MVFALVRGRLTAQARHADDVEQLRVVAILVAAIVGGKFVCRPIAHDPHPLAGPAVSHSLPAMQRPECFRELAKQTKVLVYFMASPLYVKVRPARQVKQPRAIAMGLMVVFVRYGPSGTSPAPPP